MARACYGADGSAEVDALSAGFAGGVKELALDSDWLLLRDADRSGKSALGSVCSVGEEAAARAPKDFMLEPVGAAVPPAAAIAPGHPDWARW